MVMVKFDFMFGCGDMPGLQCNVLQLCYTRSTCIEHKYIFHTHTLNLYFLLVNSIHRDSLWKIMKTYGIPGKLINLIKVFYGDFKCSVMDEGETSEWFDVKTGVKQGCNMSGLLFLIAMDWIMRRSMQNGETGIRWNFNNKLDDLDFADDVALLSSTKQHIQMKTTKLVEESERLGLKVNVGKTKVLRINARNEGKIYIKGEEIEDVTSFIYLGATVTPEGGGMGDMKNRLSKARNTFTRLKKIWSSNNIRRKTKLQLYKTLVLPVLLYGSETWKINKGDNKMIDTFQNKCLRKIMKIKWEDRVRNEDLLIRTKMKPISEEVSRRRWKFIGHTLRQDPTSDCNIALTWAPEGRRKRGRPKTTWRRTVEKERADAGWRSWNETRVAAADRIEWRRSVEALCATRHEEDR